MAVDFPVGWNAWPRKPPRCLMPLHCIVIVVPNFPAPGSDEIGLFQLCEKTRRRQFAW